MRLVLASLCLLGAISHDLIRNFEEHLIDIAASFGRSFKEFEAELFSELLSLLFRDHSVWQIRFVGNQHLGHSTVCMCLDLFQPVLNIAESALFSAIIDQNNSHRTLVICLGDSTETLLASCVPYLQLDSLVLNINGLDLEVDSNGWHVTSWEMIL